MGATSVAFTPMIYVSLPVHGFPPTVQNDPFQPAPGWNAVGVTQWKVNRLGLHMQEPNARLWPDAAKPVERVGRSILLYYFAPARTR